MSDDRVPRGEPHRYAVTVQFEDVDQYAIAHHSRTLLWCERARVDLMRRLGARMAGADAPMLVVVEAQVWYRRSAAFLDELVVRQGFERVGASRLEARYCVDRGEERVADARLVLAVIGRDGRPVRAPEAVRAALREIPAPR